MEKNTEIINAKEIKVVGTGKGYREKVVIPAKEVISTINRMIYDPHISEINILKHG